MEGSIGQRARILVEQKILGKRREGERVERE